MEDDPTQSTESSTPQLSYTEQLREAVVAGADVRIKLRSSIRTRNGYLGIIGALTVLLVLHYAKVLPVSIWIIVPAWSVIVLLTLAWLGTDTAKLTADVEKWESMRRLYSSFLKLRDDSSTAPSYFDRLVTINVENLAAYYALVQNHTAKSFQVAIASGILGFALILSGLAVSFSQPGFANIGYIGAAAGTIIDMLAGIFFYLYNRTVIQLKGYHDSLLHVQNILLSFKLIESLDQNDKNILMQTMIEYLVASPQARIPVSEHGGRITSTKKTLDTQAATV